MHRSALLAAVVATAAALAACGDSPTTPSAAAGAAPSASLAGAGNQAADGILVGPIGRDPLIKVTLHVGDQGYYGDYGAPGTAIEFKTTAGYAKIVADNSAADSDARVGYYAVMMPKSNVYTVTATAAPEELSLGGATKTGGASMTPTWIDMGSLILYRKPGLQVKLMKEGAAVFGQTVKITSLSTGWTVTITDGGANDEAYGGGPGANDGKINLRLPLTGSYSVCALTTPQTFWEADCVTAHAGQYYVAYSATLTYVQKWIVVPF
jgi:hypothetical protein